MNEPILPRIARNEPDATRDCIQRYEALVWSLARRFCRNRADAEDAVQDVFVELWRCAARYNPLLASESTFVGVVARRELIDRSRSRMRRRDDQHLGDDQQALHNDPLPAETREEAQRTSHSIARLGRNEQLVLSLALNQGMTHATISKTTGIPVGTVKTHVRRGLMKLRWMLAPDEEGRAADAPRVAGRLAHLEVRNGAA